jgi:hypothetical protein
MSRKSALVGANGSASDEFAALFSQSGSNHSATILAGPAVYAQQIPPIKLQALISAGSSRIRHGEKGRWPSHQPFFAFVGTTR